MLSDHEVNDLCCEYHIKDSKDGTITTLVNIRCVPRWSVSFTWLKQESRSQHVFENNAISDPFFSVFQNNPCCILVASIKSEKKLAIIERLKDHIYSLNTYSSNSELSPFQTIESNETLSNIKFCDGVHQKIHASMSDVFLDLIKPIKPKTLISKPIEIQWNSKTEVNEPMKDDNVASQELINKEEAFEQQEQQSIDPDTFLWTACMGTVFGDTSFVFLPKLTFSKLDRQWRASESTFCYYCILIRVLKDLQPAVKQFNTFLESHESDSASNSWDTKYEELFKSTISKHLGANLSMTKDRLVYERRIRALQLELLLSLEMFLASNNLERTNCKLQVSHLSQLQVSEQIDTILDRLSIMQSLSEEAEDDDDDVNGGHTGNSQSKSFSLYLKEVIVPFYAQRLPALIASISHKIERIYNRYKPKASVRSSVSTATKKKTQNGLKRSKSDTRLILEPRKKQQPRPQINPLDRFRAMQVEIQTKTKNTPCYPNYRVPPPLKNGPIVSNQKGRVIRLAGREPSFIGPSLDKSKLQVTATPPKKSSKSYSLLETEDSVADFDRTNKNHNRMLILDEMCLDIDSSPVTKK